MNSTEKQRTKDLLEKLAGNTASESELRELTGLLQEPGSEGSLEAVLKTIYEKAEASQVALPADWEAVWSGISQRTVPAKLRRIQWWSVAAAVVVLVFGAIFFLKQDRPGKTAVTLTAKQDMAAPVKTRAHIQLSNGKSISLDSLTQLQQAGVELRKTKDGKIIYEGTSTEIVYNTLSNPRGSTVADMTLSDGTHVWLNAGSSVTYPVSFTGSDRAVSMTGEAYFEVAHNAAMPFKVDVAGKGEVEVLGTHFNVNAYADEPAINTTLLEGSVKFSTGRPGEGQVVKLSPGQQAQLKTDGQITLNNNADMDEVMAWKNGLFMYENANLKDILRQFARWYDVQIVYGTEVSNGKYFCMVNKSTSLSNVLKTLQAGNIKFRIEGNRLIVGK